MADHGTPSRLDDAGIVRDLEAVYVRVQEAAAGATPERSGVLNSLRLMLEPSIRAARLLGEEDVNVVRRG